MTIYVTGATSNENLAVYHLIKESFSNMGHEVKTPLDTIEFCKTHTDKERFDKAMKDIDAADLVISEISGPSCGQGFELGVLFAKGFKNVVLITSSSSYTSGILKGAFGEPIMYDRNNLSELISKLQAKLK